MPVARDSKPQDPPELTPTEARQGFRGRHVMWVLAISLGLIVVIYAIMVGGVWNGRLSQPGGQTRADQSQASTFNAPPSQPRESENPQTTGAATTNSSNGRGQGG